MSKQISFRWLALLLLHAALLGSCAFSTDPKTKADTQPAPVVPLQDLIGGARYETAKLLGTITDPQLTEISGLTPSRTLRGAWWVHNDSGDQARLYAVNSRGQLLAKFTVTEAKNVDWEDLASGPGPDGKPALYLADSGNNSLSRSELTLYRVAEPSLAGAVPKRVLMDETEVAEAFPFRYPDGKHDAEALFLDPQSGRPYLVTKKMTPPCAVYRFPLPLQAGKTVTLEKVTTGKALLAISQLVLVTGAATSPDGKRVVIRTYFTALELARTGGKFETLFNAEPQTIKIPLEKQGEAISYTLDGKALVTTSEKLPAPFFQMLRSAK
ncbi:MAG: hypothetical protein HYR56_04535 [Acidobacteria bacterium]|nr:hypothetical protein [Acidobacteriota bacterium]MBI3426551.1 hypothetical protein [Acidobacteriota bacterium]